MGWDAVAFAVVVNVIGAAIALAHDADAFAIGVAADAVVVVFVDDVVKRKEIKKSFTRGHVKDIGSAEGMQSYEGHGTKRICP